MTKYHKVDSLTKFWSLCWLENGNGNITWLSARLSFISNWSFSSVVSISCFGIVTCFVMFTNSSVIWKHDHCISIQSFKQRSVKNRIIKCEKWLGLTLLWYSNFSSWMLHCSYIHHMAKLVNSRDYNGSDLIVSYHITYYPPFLNQLPENWS